MNHLNQQIAVRFAGAGSARVCGKAVIAFDVGNSHSRPCADIATATSIRRIAVIR
jgi:hypothetical protein